MSIAILGEDLRPDARDSGAGWGTVNTLELGNWVFLRAIQARVIEFTFHMVCENFIFKLGRWGILFDGLFFLLWAEFLRRWNQYCTVTSKSNPSPAVFYRSSCKARQKIVNFLANINLTHVRSCMKLIPIMYIKMDKGGS